MSLGSIRILVAIILVVTNSPLVASRFSFCWLFSMYFTMPQTSWWCFILPPMHEKYTQVKMLFIFTNFGSHYLKGIPPLTVYVPGSKVAIYILIYTWGMVIPFSIGNPYNGYINPYYFLNPPLTQGTHGSLDPIAHG